MDRQIVYAGAIPLDVDQLQQARNVLTGLGWAIRAFLGTNNFVDGLACTPTGPATMQVQVAPGAIYTLQNLDNTAFGSLAADIAAQDQIMKQGLLKTAIVLPCPAPSAVGQSINYLVEAAYNDVDGGATVLPYFNSANPAQPFSGPNNTGVSNNTVRQGLCQVQIKAGVAAATGSQTTPAPDTGFVPLFVVTVAQSTSSITAGNIFQAPGAPFINTKLSNARTQLTANLTLFVAPAASGGNDSNTGLSALSPFLTLQRAWNFVQSSIDPAGFSVNVQMAAGTYTASFIAFGADAGGGPSGAFNIIGNASSPGTVTLAVSSGSNIQASNGAIISVSGLTLTNSGGGACLAASHSGQVGFGNIVFGSCVGGAHVQTGTGGLCQAVSNYTISGGANQHWFSGLTGSIVVEGTTITLTGTPAFSSAFAFAQGCGAMLVDSNIFSGSATGARFNVSSNGVIATGGAASTYLPGNATGVTATGGQYV